MTQAFTDENGGYYQTEEEEGVPAWAVGMTPCEVRPPTQPDPKDVIRAQIAAMEREQLMPRATREFMILFMEASFPAEALAANPGYQAVKAFDQQIAALRAQL